MKGSVFGSAPSLILCTVVDGYPNQLIVSFLEGDSVVWRGRFLDAPTWEVRTVSQVERRRIMTLTNVEAHQLRQRIRELRLSGDPLAAMKIQQALDAEIMPDQSDMSDGGVRTDIPVKRGTNLAIPPRFGKGSGLKKWAAFAAKVTDMDSEVLSRMQRDDIVKMLVAKGNIPEERSDIV